MAAAKLYIIRIILNMLTTLSDATVTPTGPEVHRMFHFNPELMLTDHVFAQQHVAEILGWMKIPMDNGGSVILNLIIDAAQHVVDGRPSAKRGGLPIFTIHVSVHDDHVCLVAWPADEGLDNNFP